MKLDPAAFTKLGTAFVAFCGAVYFEFSPIDHDTGHAWVLFTGGLAALGWTAQGAQSAVERAEIRAGQADLKAGLDTIATSANAPRDLPPPPA